MRFVLMLLVVHVLECAPLSLSALRVALACTDPFFKGALANYSLFSLCDASAGYAAANGGVWYAQHTARGGPVVHLFREFERRVVTVLAAVQGNPAEPLKLRLRGQQPHERIVRFGASAGHRKGGAADILVYDQSVINNILLSEVLGYEAHMYTHTHLDDALPVLGRRPPTFWQVAARPEISQSRRLPRPRDPAPP